MSHDNSGPFLTDIVFIEEGNPSEIDGLINISKRLLTYRTICMVLKGKTPYRFTKINRLYTYLYLLREQLTEKEIEEMSSQRIKEEQAMKQS